MEPALRLRTDRGVCSVGFLPDSTSLLVSGNHGRTPVWFWDVREPAPKERFDRGQPAGYTCASPDGSLVLSFTGGDSADLWAATDKRFVAAVELSGALMAEGYRPQFAADSKTFVAYSAGRELMEFDARGVFVRRIPSSESPRRFAFAPDGKSFVLQLWDGRVRVYDLPGYTERLLLPVGTGDSRYLLAVSPDGKRLLVNSRTTKTGPGRFSWWDLSTGKAGPSFEPALAGKQFRRARVMAMAVTPDARVIAAVSGAGVFLTDATSGAVLAEVATGLVVEDGCLSPDGKLVAVAGLLGSGSGIDVYRTADLLTPPAGKPK